MNTAPPACFAIALLLMVAGSAAAQTQSRATSIYRCGADGRDLRDSPCPGSLKASAARVEFDQPSEAQAREAQARSEGDAKRAQQLQKHRLQQEAEARRQAGTATGINGLAGAPVSTPASGPKTTKAAKTSKPKPVKTNKPAQTSG
jgi:hypothetical protein